MDQGVAAGVRRFPTRLRVIKELSLRDQGFWSLCADYAEVEAALRRWTEASSPLRERRSAEYRELCDDLAGEIESALDAVAVVPSSIADAEYRDEPTIDRPDFNE